MNGRVVYIPETKDFIIDGKVVNEAELQANEAAILKKTAQQAKLLHGNDDKPKGDVLLS